MGILSHELGHAFHFWSLKDAPYHGLCWPPSLEEIPSTFTEIALVEELIQQSSSPSLSSVLHILLSLRSYPGR